MLSRVSRGLLAAAFACVCAAITAAPCAAQTVTWTGAGDGIHWTQAANWSSTPALPGPNNDVVIGAGAGTVLLDLSTSVRSLACSRNLTVTNAATLTLAQPSTISATFTLGGSATITGAGNVTLSGPVNWTAGMMSGTGRTILAAGATMTISGAGLKELRRPLDTQGSVTWTAGQLKFTGGTLTNTGTFTAAGIGSLSATQGGGTNAINNLGSFIKQGSAAAEISTGLPFNNGGTVTVQQGIFRLQGGGSHAGGFSGPAGTTLALAGAHQFLSGAVVASTLDVQVESGASTFAGPVAVRTLTVLGGALTCNGPVSASTLEVAGGSATFTAAVTVPTIQTGGTTTFGGAVTTTTLTVGGNTTFNGTTIAASATLTGAWRGSGNATITGSLTFTGFMSGTGVTTVVAGAALSLRGGQLTRLLECAGAAVWSTTAFDIEAPGILRIMPGGTFDASGQTIRSFESPGTIDVRGAMTKTGGVTTTLQCRLSNSGSFTVATATLELEGGTTNLDVATGTFAGGSWTLGNGATLRFPAGHSIQTLASGTAVTLTGPGAQWSALSPLRTLNGELTLGPGQQLTPGRQYDGLINNGRIRLEVGSRLAVGPYIQGPDGVMSIAYLGPSVQQHGRLQAHGVQPSIVGAVLDGRFEVTSAVAPPGCLDQVRSVFGGPVTGQFAQLTLPAQSPQAPQWRVRYEPDAVRLTRTIRVDLDDNGRIEPADVAAFTAAWLANLTGGGLGADFDGDGVIAPADVSLFVVQWFDAAGVCNSGN